MDGPELVQIGGENGVENLGRERFSTPDPKWTAQREGGGGECMNRDIKLWEHSRRPKIDGQEHRKSI